MAEFVTKKENNRRLAIIIVCVIVDAVALAVGIYAMKQTSDIEKKPENPRSLVKLIQQVKDQRKATQDLEDSLLLYGKEIGWKMNALGDTDRFSTGGLEGQALKNFLSDAAKPTKEMKDKDPKTKSLLEQLGIIKYARWDDPAGGERLYLTTLFEELLNKETEYKTKIGDLESQIKGEGDKRVQVIKKIEDENKAIKEKIEGAIQPNQPAAGLIGELIRLMKDINKKQSDHSTELAGLELDTIGAQNKATEVKNENLRKRAAAEAVKADLRRRIYTISFHREQAKERRDPDGEILGINEGRQICYINLLRKDRLFRGTRFYVYGMKAGQKLDKGIVEVVEVREALSSIAAVIKTTYPDWPIKVGDKIYNELYEGGRPRYIAFAGRFTGRLSNEEAAMLIRDFGDHYQDKVDERTNYLVVAEGYEDHPNYKAALEYGVKVLREKILYEYLGVKRE